MEWGLRGVDGPVGERSMVTFWEELGACMERWEIPWVAGEF